MALVLIENDHFSGGRNEQPTPDVDKRDLAKLVIEIQEEINKIESGIIGPDDASRGHSQAAPATANDLTMIAPAAGVITVVQAAPTVAAAVGESMSVNVEINGAPVMSVAAVIDDTTALNVVEGAIDLPAVFAKGDKITVDRVYAAGGAPTPITDTLVDIGYRLD